MTTATNEIDWASANQRHLMAALALVKQALVLHANRAWQDAGAPARDEPASSPSREMEQARQQMSEPPALETLCQAFGLSPFERDVLLMSAGIELDGSFAALCASAQNDVDRGYPTFGLALATLGDVHWSAMAPTAPLRYWRLIDTGSGRSLVDSPLRIDERILHYLAGAPHLDENLIGFVEPVGCFDSLVPSHQRIVNAAVASWSGATPKGPPPVIQLCGLDRRLADAIASATCTALGLTIYRMPASVLPTTPVDFETLLRLWQRESMLGHRALLLDCHDGEVADAARVALAIRALEALSGPLIVISRQPRTTRGRQIVTFDIGKPTRAEQRALWRDSFAASCHRCASGEDADSLALNGEVDRLVAQFDLNPQAIAATCDQAVAAAATTTTSSEPDSIARQVWNACLVQVRPRLEDLAQRIESPASWDDLVLPDRQLDTLHDVARHVRHRTTVYDKWGFAAKSARGLGISALFAGSSGTGKTLAAEVVAGALQLDLYRIDLSQVVSKYIGETEKNLRRVFDAADEGGAVLLFDEADALFGKRSEVKDSHDRYANIEISYLLQRMEAYRGLAILTTNMKSALDTAFLRRIRFIVEFPFPDAEHRAKIWRGVFPAETPTEALDVARLAQLNIAGGNIHNIALAAAFLAADKGRPVSMLDLLAAARSEYLKLDKSLTEVEIKGWV